MFLPYYVLCYPLTWQKNRIDSILDAEREFKLFQADVAHSSRAEVPERYVRLNPDLREPPPALDAVSKMKELQESVRQVLRSSVNELLVERTAYRMVASTFYFAKNSEFERDERSGAFIFTGKPKSGQRNISNPDF